MKSLKRDRKQGLLLALLLTGFVAFAHPRVSAAPLPTPNQPILVVQDSSSTHRFQNFIPEMLTTEGAAPVVAEALSQLPPSAVLSVSVQLRVPDPPFRI